VLGWLQHMGYGSSAHKKYFMGRVKTIAGLEWMGPLSKAYKNPAVLGMTRQELRCFWMSVCKNGWEWFVRALIEKSGVRKGRS